jgi:2,3-diphosphopglycerate-independent phosphoglycerate mutase
MAGAEGRGPRRSRVAFVLVDGIGDVSVPSLGGRTPLDAACAPRRDAVAAAGVTGLMDPVEPGLACGSDTAHLSLLGYDPREYYRGRGAFESMGAGLAMAPGDIAFKVGTLFLVHKSVAPVALVCVDSSYKLVVIQIIVYSCCACSVAKPDSFSCRSNCSDH